jgi:hypothetical protein
MAITVWQSQYDDHGEDQPVDPCQWLTDKPGMCTVPAGHSRHSEKPVPGAYLPPGQGVRTPPVQYSPAPHTSTPVRVITLEPAPSGVEYDPFNTSIGAPEPTGQYLSSETQASNVSTWAAMSHSEAANTHSHSQHVQTDASALPLIDGDGALRTVVTSIAQPRARRSRQSTQVPESTCTQTRQQPRPL